MRPVVPMLSLPVHKPFSLPSKFVTTKMMIVTESSMIRQVAVRKMKIVSYHPSLFVNLINVQDVPAIRNVV